MPFAGGRKTTRLSNLPAASMPQPVHQSEISSRGISDSERKTRCRIRIQCHQLCFAELPSDSCRGKWMRGNVLAREPNEALARFARSLARCRPILLWPKKCILGKRRCFHRQILPCHPPATPGARHRHAGRLGTRRANVSINLIHGAAIRVG